MDKLTIQDYFLRALKLNLINNVDWMVLMFNTPVSNLQDNKYFRIDKNNYVVKLEDVEYLLTGSVYPSPPLDHKSKVTITSDYIENIDGFVDTDIAKAIINKILFAIPFGNIVPYQNEKFSLGGDIEDLIISNKLADNDKAVKGKTISVDDYVQFIDNATYLRSIADMFVVSTTEKIITPAPGIIEYRDKLIKEYTEKYGDKVFEDASMISEVNSKLKEYDNKYIGDDPTNGVLLSGKVKNISREKMYITTGPVSGFSTDNKVTHVPKSFNEGWDVEDSDQLTAAYNNSREGSYKRGFETRNGGYFAKIVLRAIGSSKIIDTDCGTKIGKPVTITKGNLKSLTNKYHFIGAKTTKLELDYLKANIGNTISLRTSMTCNMDKDQYCRYCMGENLFERPNGLSLSGTEITSNILNTSLAAMHGKELDTVEIDLDEVLS